MKPLIDEYLDQYGINPIAVVNIIETAKSVCRREGWQLDEYMYSFYGWDLMDLYTALDVYSAFYN